MVETKANAIVIRERFYKAIIVRERFPNYQPLEGKENDRDQGRGYSRQKTVMLFMSDSGTGFLSA